MVWDSNWVPLSNGSFHKGIPNIQTTNLPLVGFWRFYTSTWRMGSQDVTDTWLITIVIVVVPYVGLWDPFQMAFSWLINGGY